MGTAFSDTFARLAEPFHPDDVKKLAHSGMPYITSRSVMNRLDEVLGPENWDVEFEPFGPHAVRCTLTVCVRAADGQVGGMIKKQGIGARSTMSTKAAGKVDPGDDDKGGESDALKRAAVYLGVGRYLYNDGQVDYRGPDRRDDRIPEAGVTPASGGGELGRVAKFIAWCESNGHRARAEAMAKASYGKESLTLVSPEQAEAIYGILKGARALAEVPPPRPRDRPPQARSRGPVNENGSPVDFGWPRSGASLYAWCKNLQGAYDVGFFPAVEKDLARPGGWPDSVKEWSPEQVEAAARHVAGLVSRRPGYDGQFDVHLPDAAKYRAKLRARARELLGLHGVADASAEEVEGCLASVAAELHGGETLGPLDACEDAARMKAVLDQVEKDIADGHAFETFEA